MQDRRLHAAFLVNYGSPHVGGDRFLDPQTVRIPAFPAELLTRAFFFQVRGETVLPSCAIEHKSDSLFRFRISDFGFRIYFPFCAAALRANAAGGIAPDASLMQFGCDIQLRSFFEQGAVAGAGGSGRLDRDGWKHRFALQNPPDGSTTKNRICRPPGSRRAASAQSRRLSGA